MMAQVWKIPLINKMMTLSREASARRPSRTEIALDAMTQYGAEEPRVAFVESEEQGQQTTELLKAALVGRGRLGRSYIESRPKATLSREDVHDICKAQDLHEDGPQL